MKAVRPVFFCEQNFTDKQAAAMRLESINIVAGLPDEPAEALRILDLAREHILEWAG